MTNTQKNQGLVRHNSGLTRSPLYGLFGGTDEYPSIPSMFREMNRMMTEFDNLTRQVAPSQWAQGRGYVPAVDVSEKDNAYVLTAELPGLRPEDVEITVDHGALIIRGEKRDEHEHKEGGFHRVERHYGRFQRVFGLPEGVDPSKIEADFNNGILSLNIPKLENAQPETYRIPLKWQNKAGSGEPVDVTPQQQLESSGSKSKSTPKEAVEQS